MPKRLRPERPVPSRSVSALTLAVALAAAGCAPAGGAPVDEDYVRGHYDKTEVRIPMRDGVCLFTAIYTPKDRSRDYPFLMRRTPYSVRPYGEDAYPDALGPNEAFTRDGFIFVYQDVRGRMMSEGTFLNMTPHIEDKDGPEDVDESTDTYDTIEWLLENVEGHNGRVGQWGISYPGFYASAGMIDAHPALVAVSPQAPIADWWYDDFHHHGAFWLPHFFGFFWFFGQPRPEPTTGFPEGLDYGTVDGYDFFMELGPLQDIDDDWYHGRVAFFDSVQAHPDYDEFWRRRNILPHLQDVAPAVMTVGGLFDAEDLYGGFETYKAIERQNPGIENVLVQGPWYHGGWARSDGDRLGDAWFGGSPSVFYRDSLELPWFRHHLKDAPDPGLAEATIFDTGRNEWRRFDVWPPQGMEPRILYLREEGGLAWNPPNSTSTSTSISAAFDAFISDPGEPVPFTREIRLGMSREYITEDQRLQGRRPDVLVWQTEPLEEAVTLAGPVTAELWVSTSQRDADWVVKLIDVFPGDAPDSPAAQSLPLWHTGGYQMMVRSEAIRGRYRNDPSRPEPFTPNRPAKVELPLVDVMHTFRPGHRIMVQVQSTWFPLMDRNPQKWVDNLYTYDDEDGFVAAEHRVYRRPGQASRLRVGVVPER